MVIMDNQNILKLTVYKFGKNLNMMLLVVGKHQKQVEINVRVSCARDRLCFCWIQNQIINKKQLNQMSTAQCKTPRLRLQHIKLPKLTATKVFRVRSASKQKNQTSRQKSNSNRGKPAGMAKKLGEIFHSNDKFRSSSLKNMPSKKSLKRKSETNCNSSDEDFIQVGSCRFNSKINNHPDKQSMQRQHEINMLKLNQIARMFDPKTIMKLGRKNSECSQEQNPKQQKPKHPSLKSQIRFNQFIFEGKHHKSRKQKQTEADQIQNQYWKKVNESLILAPFKPIQNQVSKDLRQIYQTLVTE